MGKRFTYLIIAIFSIVFAAGAQPQKAFKIFAEKIAKARAVSFEFENASLRLKGKLIAAKNGKFRAETRGRIFVCDGTAIWNYSPSENKVIVSKKDDSGDEIRIEEFALNFPKYFAPLEYSDYNSSDLKSAWKIKLIPKKKDKFADLKYCSIYLDKTKNYPKALELIFEDGTTERWLFRSFKIINPPKEAFVFKIPKNCEIVDLRDF